MARLASGLVGWVIGCLFLMMVPSQAFYIGGDTYRAYKMGERVPIKFNKLISWQSLLTYGYNDLPFVCPRSSFTPKDAWLNIGQVLQGDSWTATDHELYMGRNDTCQLLCTVELSPKTSRKLISMGDSGYGAEWVVDNLPVTYFEEHNGFLYMRLTAVPLTEGAKGFRPIPSFRNIEETAIMNHMSLWIDYVLDTEDPSKAYIVGVNASAQSIDDPSNCMTATTLKQKSSAPAMIMQPNETNSLTYSYSVFWRQSLHPVSPKERWNDVLHQQSYVHWYSIYERFVYAMIITCIFVAVVAKKLRVDIQRGDASRSTTQVSDGFVLHWTHGAWKLLHADVFRTPRFATLLISLLGFGVQFSLTLCTLIGIMLCGFLSPAYRGGLLTVAFVLYPFFGLVAGYVVGYMHSLLRCRTSLLYQVVHYVSFVPGIIFVLRFGVSTIAWMDGSSLAIPFGTWMVALIVAFGVSGLLALIGAMISGRKTYNIPVEVSDLARTIPPKPWCFRSYITLPICMILPFYIYISEYIDLTRFMWRGEFYWTYGYLALVLLMSTFVTIGSTLVVTYLCLNYEDHHWWWRSFFHSAVSAGGIIIISFIQHFSEGGVGITAAALFFGYNIIAFVLYAVTFGTLGFLSTFVLLRIIYGSIKTD
ncbi:uncharacterized protein BYT42DRAFT_98447 [Radiomyces spectabilis]|uniref:uncharacterized protein n=1 Tax=Radiomyces spectabilis TaxID=64574 RepID=UPI00221ED3D5|nr:uncharacterized protein BYT42DRAFT_98447 [Radiomyces spectabilis]KAI8370674.1 hypothetical protein BYT42DRAFT_98447 [Radiomyces spectabilis]